jgi:transposase InsO family protein
MPVATLSKIYEQLHQHLQAGEADDNRPIAKDLTSLTASIAVMNFPSLPVIIAEQKKDEHIAPLFEYLLKDKDPKLLPRGRYERAAPYCRIYKKTIFYRETLGSGEVLTDVVVLPDSLKPAVLRALHDGPYAGHPGPTATVQSVRQQCYWRPSMTKEIKNYIKNCADCRKAKIVHRTHAGSTNRQLFARHHQVLAIDLIGVFVTVGGMRYVCHVTDELTGWNYVMTLPNKEALTVAKAFHQEVILKHGWPEVLLSDNGTEFANKIITALAEEYGFKHIRSSPMQPRGNSFVENRHRHYNAILKVACKKYGMSWPTAIHFANWCLNTRPYKGTTYSPYDLLFASPPPKESEMAFADFQYSHKVSLPAEEFLANARMYQQNARAIVEQAKIDTMIHNRASDPRRYTVSHETGSLVLVKAPIVKKGTTRRLLYQCTGPFEGIGPSSPPNGDGPREKFCDE